MAIGANNQPQLLLATCLPNQKNRIGNAAHGKSHEPADARRIRRVKQAHALPLLALAQSYHQTMVLARNFKNFLQIKNPANQIAIPGRNCRARPGEESPGPGPFIPAVCLSGARSQSTSARPARWRWVNPDWSRAPRRTGRPLRPLSGRPGRCQGCSTSARDPRPETAALEASSSECRS